MPLTLDKAPVTRPFFPDQPANTVVESVPWEVWFRQLKRKFDTVASATVAATQVIREGSHSGRVALNPADYPHTLYIETDRNRIVYESDGAHWHWFAGTMATTLGVGIALLGATLGSFDTGLLAYDAAYDRTFKWTGLVFLEINARDRSIHMCAETPESAGYALCDGSSVTRSRPDGSTYSWATPNLSGLYPKFGSAYTGMPNAAVPPTIHASIPAGTLTHHHAVDIDSGDAKDDGGDPWKVIYTGDLTHRHNISDQLTGPAFDDMEAPWSFTGAISGSGTGTLGGSATIGGSAVLPAHSHITGSNVGIQNPELDGEPWVPVLGADVSGSISGATDSVDISHGHSFSAAGGTDASPGGLVMAPLFEYPTAEVALVHTHGFTVSGFTDAGGGSHAHAVGGSFAGSGPVTGASGVWIHSHFVEGHTDGIYCGSPVPIDISGITVDTSGLTVDVSDFVFTAADSVDHHHHMTGETETGMDEFSLDGAPHHHNTTGDTADSVQASPIALTATADADAQMANMILKGYISL
jgi:hypothetical protein